MESGSFLFLGLDTLLQRGLLENELLLSSFTRLYLTELSDEKLRSYLGFLCENDRDIFRWLVHNQAVPEDVDAELVGMLQEHVRNNPLEVLRKDDEANSRI